MKFSKISVVTVLVLFVSLSSCIKNTDFEQATDAVIHPVVELDLIYFDVAASQFYDAEKNTPNLIVRDTTALEFLDSGDLRDALIKAEFLFKFTNSIPREFSVSYDFLNSSNTVQHSSSTLVNAGSVDTPVETIFIDVLNEGDIDNLTLSNKVVVSVEIPQAEETLTGNLNVQSKGTYYLEID